MGLVVVAKTMEGVSVWAGFLVVIVVGNMVVGATVGALDTKVESELGGAVGTTSSDG